VHKGVQVGLDDAGEGEPALDNEESGEVDTGKRLTKTDVREWVRGQLSNHLVPKYVFWVKEYPKTASGKIQKFKLREMGMQMLKDAEIKKGNQVTRI
jgi:acyl-coenzyme A synthetase/AMP-(fatty) acid ligase